MNYQAESPTSARLLFMGEAALGEGFRLIGFETWTDPTPEMLEQQLDSLIKNREKAFIVLGHALADCDCTLLNRVRAEGGHIIITQVPSLADPDHLQCAIDDRLQSLLGGEVRVDQE